MRYPSYFRRSEVGVDLVAVVQVGVGAHLRQESDAEQTVVGCSAMVNCRTRLRSQLQDVLDCQVRDLVGL